MAENYHMLTPSEAIALLNSSKNGLTEEEAKNRLEEYGLNELKKEKKAGAFMLFINQFRNALSILLIFAGIISLFISEKLEAIAIFCILFINSTMGFIQEYRAEKAMEALQKISAPTARVFRSAKLRKVPASTLVPGDIVMLDAGDIVPADSRLIEVASLYIDEASLTGESVPSKKFIEPLGKDTSVADRENMAYTGTIVTYGKGKAIVIATAMSTEFGKIATSIQETEVTETPLQRKFGQLAKQIGIVVIGLIIFVLVGGIAQKTVSLGNMLLFALALTVSTIPSSLPIIVTVSLSMGAKRLSKKNMLIKKLPAAESLGAATIICSDKTGTITKNQMTITHIYANDKIINVTGAGYEPKGEFRVGSKVIDPKELELLLRIGYLCNNARLEYINGKHELIGNPTEGSLIVLAKKGRLDEQAIKKRCVLAQELPFDSERKRMSVIFKNDRKPEAYVKGAPDILLEVCTKVVKGGKVYPLTDKERKKILSANNRFAEQALRVLGLAYKDIKDTKKYTLEQVEKDLIFIGLVGMMDPPREEVENAVKECHEAGIKVMLITGDHAITTKAIARKIGLFSKGDMVLTGDELDKMTDEELEKNIDNVRIIARALPIQKSRIVDILQKKGHIVAMTGDGVNDAPALKKSDIGISMGKTGTDVSKEVSEAILADDNFASIVSAIEEGRNIYDKMIKSARYLLACNSGEIASVFTAIMLGFPLPLLPLQLLLMNLLTDTLPGLGLGFESSDEGIMKRKPRHPKQRPISGAMFLSIIFFGLIMAFGTLYVFSIYKNTDLVKAQTAAFTTLVTFQMFAVLSSRSLHPSLRKLNPFTNLWLFGSVILSMAVQVWVIYWPPLQAIFGTVSLAASDWVYVIGIASLGFVLMELSKFATSRKC